MDFYHVLNRGVDKRKVFMEDGDLVRFVHDLYAFNDERSVAHYTVKARHAPPTRMRTPLVHIHAFSLMPNHYHLLLSPVLENGIPRFIKKLNMGYAKYFNEKYSRIGSLWQGKYKKIHIERDAHFLYIPFYIHLNPLDLSMPAWRDGSIRNPQRALDYLREYRWSSHLDYCGFKNFPSVIHHEVLSEALGNRRAYENQISEIISNPELASHSNALE